MPIISIKFAFASLIYSNGVMQILVKCYHFNHKAEQVNDYTGELNIDDAIEFQAHKYIDVLKSLNPRSCFIEFAVHV